MESIIQFDKEIEKLSKEINKILKLSDTEILNITKKENELNKNIDELKKKLGIPIEKKENENKLINTIENWDEQLKANGRIKITDDYMKSKLE